MVDIGCGHDVMSLEEQNMACSGDSSSDLEDKSSDLGISSLFSSFECEDLPNVTDEEP